MKAYEDIYIYIYIYIKAFTLKAIAKIYIQWCSFSKARDIVQKFWVSKTTQKKLLQKHLKSGICSKGNAYYPAFSCFTGWSCPGIFFMPTHTLIVKLQSFQFLNTSAVPFYTLNFKKTFHISRKWQIDWSCECLVRMHS